MRNPEARQIFSRSPSRVSRVLAALVVSIFAAASHAGCKGRDDSDSRQQEQQETLLAEATARTGMPAVRNFRERGLYKMILERRDEDLVTYTYTFSEQTGRLVFFCDSVGYGFPAATQYTSPQKAAFVGSNHGYVVLPQADPNGLFSPSSAEGTWVMCKDPHGKRVEPVYVEPRIVVAPFRIDGASDAGAVPPPAERGGSEVPPVERRGGSGAGAGKARSPGPGSAG